MIEGNTVEHLLTIGGWIVGGAVVVGGMRVQVKGLSDELHHLRVTLEKINDRLQRQSERLAMVEGAVRKCVGLGGANGPRLRADCPARNDDDD